MRNVRLFFLALTLSGVFYFQLLLATPGDFNGKRQGYLHNFPGKRPLAFVQNDSKFLIEATDTRLDLYSTLDFSLLKSYARPPYQILSVDPSGRFLVFTTDGNSDYEYGLWDIEKSLVIKGIKRPFYVKAPIKIKTWFIKGRDEVVVWSSEKYYHPKEKQYKWVNFIEERNSTNFEVTRTFFVDVDVKDVAVDVEKGIFSILKDSGFLQVFKFGEEIPIAKTTIPDLASIDQVKSIADSLLLVECKSGILKGQVWNYMNNQITTNLQLGQSLHCDPVHVVQSQRGQWIAPIGGLSSDYILNVLSGNIIGSGIFVNNESVLSENERWVLNQEDSRQRDETISLTDLSLVNQLRSTISNPGSRSFYSREDQKLLLFDKNKILEWDFEKGQKLLFEGPENLHVLHYSARAKVAILAENSDYGFVNLFIYSSDSKKLLKKTSRPYCGACFIFETSNQPENGKFTFHLHDFNSKSKIFQWDLYTNADPEVIWESYDISQFYLDSNGTPVLRKGRGEVELFDSSNHIGRTISIDGIEYLTVSVAQSTFALVKNPNGAPEHIEIYDLQTGQLRLKIDDSRISFTKLALDPTKNILAAIGRFTLDLFNLDSNEKLILSSLPLVDVGSGRFDFFYFPNGKVLIATNSKGFSAAWCFDKFLW